jgi:hypothetical protein
MLYSVKGTPLIDKVVAEVTFASQIAVELRARSWRVGKIPDGSTLTVQLQGERGYSVIRSPSVTSPTNLTDVSVVDCSAELAEMFWTPVVLEFIDAMEACEELEVCEDAGLGACLIDKLTVTTATIIRAIATEAANRVLVFRLSAATMGNRRTEKDLRLCP